MNLLTWILTILLFALLVFHMFQMRKANKIIAVLNPEHHEDLHNKLEMATLLVDTAAPTIEKAANQILELEAEKLTLNARIDELIDEVGLLEERTHSTIDDQLKRMARELNEANATITEASSEIIKLSDKLLKADRQNVSIQRVVSEQESIIDRLTGELAATARELAEIREAADQPEADDLMALADATSNSHDV